MSDEYVILVDEQDNETGVMEKLLAHQKGLLHRAFSIFIFNDNNELLLQQRASSKYHSAGLWTNTCCSHPKPNETVKDAASRRLFEEMGMQCELKIINSFIYKAPFDNGLTEHELDYILIGKSNQIPKLNLLEVQNFKWQLVSEIKNDLKINSINYTYWFNVAINKFF
jgi:isopentenyl-diphosphate delta-isomerase